MKIASTNYGLFVSIDGTDYTYQLRQVRTINNNNPEEQPLINRLEKPEKALLTQFLKLAQKCEDVVKKLSEDATRPTWQKWQEWQALNGDFDDLFTYPLENLAQKINNISFVFANLSKHGYCI